MTRIYINWEKWECHKNGMWRSLPKEEEDLMLKKAIKFTSNHIIYGKWMIKAVDKWKNSMLHFLTNKSINKRAYIGHCAASLAINCPEYITRMAWKYLSEEQRILANKQADVAYNLFLKKTLQLELF